MTKLKNYAYLIVIVAVVCVGVGFGVKAFISDTAPATVMENVNIETFNQAPAQDSEDVVGSVTGPYFYGDFYVSGTMSVGGTRDGWLTGDCTDATTTLLAVDNPWNKTVYVDKFMFLQDGAATTSAYLTCGTSSASTGLSSDPSDLLIDDFSLATSSVYNIMNALAGASRTATGGFSAPGTNSEDIIAWNDGEYITCFVDPAGLAASAVGFTQSTNTFSCSYKIHIFD